MGKLQHFTSLDLPQIKEDSQILNYCIVPSYTANTQTLLVEVSSWSDLFGCDVFPNGRLLLDMEALEDWMPDAPGSKYM